MRCIRTRAGWSGGVFDGYGELLASFRLDDMAMRVGPDDRSIGRWAYSRIRLLRAAEVSSAWVSVFADYEIVECLGQLEVREIREVSRAQLEAAGWLACGDEDVFQFRKPLPLVGRTLYLEVESIECGASEISALTWVEGLHFEPAAVVGRPEQVPDGVRQAEWFWLLRHD